MIPIVFFGLFNKIDSIPAVYIIDGFLFTRGSRIFTILLTVKTPEPTYGEVGSYVFKVLFDRFLILGKKDGSYGFGLLRLIGRIFVGIYLIALLF